MKKYLTIKNIIIAFISILTIVFSYMIIIPEYYKPKEKIISTIVKETKIDDNSSLFTKDFFYVDVKGAIKKPGVYKFTDGQMIIDAISAAGGLEKTASTNNINLSKKLSSQMVIYIFNKNELKNEPKLSCPIQIIPECKCETIEINNCIEKELMNQEEKNDPVIEPDSSIKNEDSTNVDQSSSSINLLININTATSQQLQELPGIGLSKATAIIKYRELTKFNSIEDIKNVSGIGDSVYNSIKNLITY